MLSLDVVVLYALVGQKVYRRFYMFTAVGYHGNTVCHRRTHALWKCK